MKLAVVIVNYNVRHYLEQCLRSLVCALEGVDAGIYVVDNHSKDGSVEALQPLFPEVNFIASMHNLGFARANNVAIRQTDSDYVLLLNPDTIVPEQTIKRCLAFMDEHPKAGALGVKMLRTDGLPANESRRGLPSPLTAFYKMIGLCTRYPQSRRFGKYYMGGLSWEEAAEIEVVSGAYCLLRREAIEQVGLLDEDFFMYGEDIDLSCRLLKGGWQNWYVPETILHYKGESTQKSSFRYVHVFYEAMLIFFRKHYGHMSWLLSFPIKLAIYFKATLALFPMLFGKMRKMLGFFTPRKKKFPAYLFLGSPRSMETCKEIVRRNGLTAQFVEADEQSLPDGHHQYSKEIRNDEDTYVVYDTMAFRYETILRIFGQKPDGHVKIGIFHPQNKAIVTDREVIK